MIRTRTSVLAEFFSNVSQIVFLYTNPTLSQIICFAERMFEISWSVFSVQPDLELDSRLDVLIPLTFSLFL